MVSQPFAGKRCSGCKAASYSQFCGYRFLAAGRTAKFFSAEHGLENRFVILYAGNIGLTQGFETIIEAARRLESVPEVCFVIIGDGTRRDWLEEQLLHARTSNVILLPYQPRSNVPQIYATSDVCLVPLKRGTAQETFPSKIYSIMAAGRPVIASVDPDSELAWVVERAECGWVVPPDDAEALATAIKSAYQQRSDLLTMGLRGRDYVVANHSRQTVARQYDSLIQAVVKHR